ncbi:hypothetical protein V8C35DRAFT_224937 [Trichoderma chlorosporum]
MGVHRQKRILLLVFFLISVSYSSEKKLCGTLQAPLGSNSWHGICQDGDRRRLAAGAEPFHPLFCKQGRSRGVFLDFWGFSDSPVQGLSMLMLSPGQYSSKSV